MSGSSFISSVNVMEQEGAVDEELQVTDNINKLLHSIYQVLY